MSNIKEYVEALPEIYQNIYGYPEYSEGKSRDCKERLVYIEKIIKAYQDYSGKRELRVLDLGCAQGFYSFSLASFGCIVDGIDFNEQNIALCKELQRENSLSCTFRQDVITKELVDQIADGMYDVIMVFSVIHHIAHEHGFDYARELMTKLADKSEYVLTELAVKEEPLYWNENLPSKYEAWFDKVLFFDEQCFFDTHLSEHKRPFVFYSNIFCYLDGDFFSITEYKQSAYEGKPVDPEKRYYLCNDNTVLVKLFRNVSEYFKTEIRSEERFLSENSDLDFVPEIIKYEENERRIIEITSIRYASLLSDLLKQDNQIDYVVVFKDILDECVELEKRGIYHNDLRPWNICVDEDGHAFMIDFGATQKDVIDRVVCQMEDAENSVLHTVFDTFVAMIYDCLRHNTYETIKSAGLYQMSFYYEFDKIPKVFANFIKQVVLLEKSVVSFEAVRSLYERFVLNKEKCDLSLNEYIRLQELQLAGLNAHKEESVRARVRAYDMSAQINKQIYDLNISLRDNSRILQNGIDASKERIEALQKNMDVLRNQNMELINALENKVDIINNRVSAIDDWLFLRFWRKTAKTLRRIIDKNKKK